ncbi:MAG: hypothetical protein KDE27_10830 [Planctomycetes bacterium]|nr:hypothetical protein [Planctomycetota bacterium]
MRLLPTLFFAVLVPSLASQGVVSPVHVGNPAAVPGLSAPAVPWVSSVDVRFVHLAGDPPNVYYTTATVTGLSAVAGGAGGLDVACGRYDVLTDTFVPNNDAAALNTPGHERDLSLHASGLSGVYIDSQSRIVLVSRATLAQPWQVVGPIALLCPCGSGNPFRAALADYRGQPQLIVNRFDTLVMGPIDLATGTMLGPDVTIVAGSLTARPDWPVPITDPSGEILGVSHSMVFGAAVADIDHYVSLDLDPNTPPLPLHDAAVQAYAGGVAGGRFVDGEWTSATGTRLVAIDRIWTTGGRAPVGGTMVVRVFSPPTPGPELYLSALAASTGFLAVGQPMPPLLGLVGIDLASAWITTPAVHDNRNGEARVGLTVPNAPALSGTRLPVQCVTLEVTSGTFYLGNTAVVAVD